MTEPLSSRKRPLEEKKDIPKKKVVAADCIILLAYLPHARTHAFTLHQIKTQSKKRPGFDEEIFSETSYFIDNGKHLFYK